MVEDLNAAPVQRPQAANCDPRIPAALSGGSGFLAVYDPPAGGGATVMIGILVVVAATVK
ncbi:MAG: hypothetical protein NTX75_14850 [Proteobacteria bacterium]|nr:hypothetical protein [Pseudomonadota bacterium]